MTTPRTRAIVSLAAALTAATLALGACARGPSPTPWDGGAAVQARPLAVRFDNEAQVHVDVYLVGVEREWRLGRVAPGARATLRLPAESVAGTAGFVRIAVLADAPPSAQAARDPRATFTIAQPAAMLVSQRWTFARRQLASPQLLGARVDPRHP